MLKKYYLLALLFSFFYCANAQSAIIIQYEDSGDDLVLNWSGSVSFGVEMSTSGFSPINGIGREGNSSVFFASPQFHKAWGTFNDAVADSNHFISLARTLGHSSTGDNLLFRFNGANQLTLWGNLGYSANTLLEGQLRIANSSISMSGISDWFTTFNGGRDSISIIAAASDGEPIEASSPNTIGIFLLGMIVCCAIRKNRRQR